MLCNNSDPANNLANAAGYLKDLKSRLHVNSLRDKQENQVRELHQWGVNNLQGIQQVRPSRCDIQVITHIYSHRTEHDNIPMFILTISTKNH